MESVVKNCGQTVHDEVANKQTMEELKEILKVNTSYFTVAFEWACERSSRRRKRARPLFHSFFVRNRSAGIEGNCLEMYFIKEQTVLRGVKG